MIRALIYTLIFTVIAYGFYLLDMHSGNIAFEALGYSIEARFWVFVLVLLVFAVLLLLTFILVYKLVNIPTIIKNFFIKRKFEKSNDLIKEYFKAATTRDNKSALKVINKISSNDEFKEYFKAASFYHQAETDVEAARKDAISLLSKAKRREPILVFIISANKMLKKVAENYGYATELFNLSPSYFAAKSRIEAMTELKDFGMALNFLDENKKYFYKEELFEIKADLELELGCNYSKTRNFTAAVRHLESSVKYKYSDYAVALLFDSYLKLSEFEIAEKIIKINWKQFAKSDKSEMVLKLSKHISPEDFLKLARDLKKVAPSEFSSIFVLAKAELGADQYDKAYKTISDAMELCKCRSAYLLMVEFCVRTHGSTAEIANWLHLAFQANEE